MTEIQLQLARHSQELRATTPNWPSGVEGLQLATDNNEVKDLLYRLGARLAR